MREKVREQDEFEEKGKLKGGGGWGGGGRTEVEKKVDFLQSNLIIHTWCAIC